MLCGNCGRSRTSPGRGGCPCIPDSFWRSELVVRALADRDAATIIRLAHHHLPRLSQEAIARMSGLASSTIHRIISGAPLSRVDRNNQALLGLGAPTPGSQQDPGQAPVDLTPVQRLLDRPERVDGAAVSVLGSMLAAQRRLDDHVGAQAMLPSARSHAAIMTVAADQARGPRSAELRLLAAEWVQFEGWLLASTGRLDRAVPVLERAAVLAQELGDGPLIAQARNFLAYIARRRADAPRVVSGFLQAFHTDGAHPAQRAGDAIQAAHGHALLGHGDQARYLLDEAAQMAEQARALPPPPTAYWLTDTFHQLNLGLAHAGLGQADVAADLISSGLHGLPADQRGADWTTEYREALEMARR